MKAKELEAWLDFDIKDDHILTRLEGAERRIYLFRILPRNMAIIGREERAEQERKFQRILDDITVAPSVLIMDKTEGLTESIAYYDELVKSFPEYGYINSEISARLRDTNSGGAAVERAYYFVLRVKDEAEMQRFYGTAEEYMPLRLAGREELMIVLRNYLLREYDTVPVLEFDSRVRLLYDKAHSGKKQTQRKPELDYIAKSETQRLLLPSRINFRPRYIEQSGIYRRVITVRTWPAEFSQDCVLRSLALLEGTTIRMYLSPIDRAVSGRMTAQQLNYKTSERRSARKSSDRIAAESDEEALLNFYRRMLENNEQMYYLNIFIECCGATLKELDSRTERAVNELRAYGITRDELIYDQRDGFLSVLPFGFDRFPLLARNMPTQTIAALYPFTASRKADPHGLYLGKTGAGSPFLLDLDRRSAEVTNSNVCIVGAPGQGKSYLLKKIISQHLARGSTVYSLDSETEYTDLFSSMNGDNLDCAGGGTVINPLQCRTVRTAADNCPDEKTDPDAFTQSSPLMQQLSWLREFFGLLWPDMTAQQLNILMILTEDLYREYGITPDYDVSDADAGMWPTMRDLYAYTESVMESFDTKRYNMFSAADLRPILLCLHDSAYGSSSALFNGHTNIKNASAINFILQNLMEGDKRIRSAMIFNIMSFVWNKIVTERQPLYFIVDELYLMMIPQLAAWLRNFEKRCRKYNATLITATQDLADYDNPEILHLAKPLLTIPAHRFYFYMGELERAAARNILNLSDTEINAIADSHRGKCLCKTGNEKYVLYVGTLSFEAELFGGGGGH